MKMEEKDGKLTQPEYLKDFWQQNKELGTKLYKSSLKHLIEFKTNSADDFELMKELIKQLNNFVMKLYQHLF